MMSNKINEVISNIYLKYLLNYSQHQGSTNKQTNKQNYSQQQNGRDQYMHININVISLILPAAVRISFSFFYVVVKLGTVKCKFILTCSSAIISFIDRIEFVKIYICTLC